MLKESSICLACCTYISSRKSTILEGTAWNNKRMDIIRNLPDYTSYCLPRCIIIIQEYMSSNLPNATVPSCRPGNTGKREQTNHKVYYMNLSIINARPITSHQI